jgi:Zn-dependent protease with chaperone function
MAAGSRRLDWSAVTAFAPLVALAPPWLVAIAVFWLPFGLWGDVTYQLFAGAHLALGIVLFSRPVQRLVFVRLLGARNPTGSELRRLTPAWNEVALANRMQPARFVLAVVEGDDVNAFACGGHLLVVSSFAIENLSHEELCGVLAHELSHHLGGHTIALTIAQWMSLPVLFLARTGLALRDLSIGITNAVAHRWPLVRLVGSMVWLVLTVVSLVLLIGPNLSRILSNIVGRPAEFQADRRAFRMGFGHELMSALQRMIGTEERRGIGAAILTSHPPAVDRVVRLDSMIRRDALRGRRGGFPNFPR